jgi:hypothetical protein
MGKSTLLLAKWASKGIRAVIKAYPPLIGVDEPGHFVLSHDYSLLHIFHTERF